MHYKSLAGLSVRDKTLTTRNFVKMVLQYNHYNISAPFNDIEPIDSKKFPITVCYVRLSDIPSSGLDTATRASLNCDGFSSV